MSYRIPTDICHRLRGLWIWKRKIGNKKFIFYNGKYPLALITAFTRSGIDLMRFTRVSGEILDKALFTTSVNCSIDEGGGSILLTFSLRIVHMFSMGDKSGELGGHISLFQKIVKFVLNQALDIRAVWALSRRSIQSVFMKFPLSNMANIQVSMDFLQKKWGEDVLLIVLSS